MSDTPATPLAAPAALSWADRAALNRPPSSIDVPTISTPALSESAPEATDPQTTPAAKGSRPPRAPRDRRPSGAQKAGPRRDGQKKSGGAGGGKKAKADGQAGEPELDKKEGDETEVAAPAPAPSKKKALPGAPKVNPWKVKTGQTQTETPSSTEETTAEPPAPAAVAEEKEQENAPSKPTTADPSFPSLAPAPAKKHRSKQKAAVVEDESTESKKGKKEKTKWKPVPQHELQFTSDLSTDRKKAFKPRAAGVAPNGAPNGSRKKKQTQHANGKKTKKPEGEGEESTEPSTADLQNLGLSPIEGDVTISKEVEKSLMKVAEKKASKGKSGAGVGNGKGQQRKGSNGGLLNATTDSFEPNQEYFYHPHPHVAGRVGGPFPSAPVPPPGSMPVGHVGKHQAGVEGAGAAYYTPPPMPIPVTIPPFQLDPLRFYLLGQLEYYFGIQNLAMDFFLRQQMDTLGYVSLSMVASFNRVKNLTTDLSLVKETMALSQLVEIRETEKETKVRLANHGWIQWVLPGAAVSEVEEGVEGGEKPVEVVERARQAEQARKEDHQPEESKDREEEEAVDAAL